MNTLGIRMLKRIRGHGSGYAFSAKDFLDLGKRGAIDVTLGRLLEAGKIRRVARGIYDYPRYSQILKGLSSPNYDQVAKAVARKTGTHIVPSGAHAANMLGLSTQVPAKVVYLTDGSSRAFKFGNLAVLFKHTHPMNLQHDPKTNLVIQAIKFLGRSAVDEKLVRQLKGILSKAERARFLRDVKYNTGWVVELARRVAEGAPDG